MPEAGPAAARVRAATARDLYAAHAFLPWIANAAVPIDGLFVAEDDDGVCGVGALSTLQADGALRADIFVHPDARRGGVGSTLLAGLCAAARAWGATRLRTWRPTDAAPALAFLARHGAAVTARLLTFESVADLTGLRKRLGPRAAAATKDVRPLQEADLPALAAFYASHLGETEHGAVHRLRTMLADPVTSALSVGMERGGVLRAFVVCQPDAQAVPRLDFWYAEPSVRGVASLALIVAAAQRAQAMGLPPVSFQCRDDARHTLRMAAEMGVAPSRVETSHELAL